MDDDVIVVVGVGTARLEPDLVRADVGLTAVGVTVGEALTGTAEAQQRLVDALVAAGVDRTAIQTSSYHAGPDHEAGRTSTRQRADTSLSVSLPASTAGALLATMSDVVGTAFRVNGVWPAASDAEPARAVARHDAVGAARRHAEQLAAAAGVRLGRLRSLIEGVAGGSHLTAGPAMARLAAASAPDVEGGELLVRVAVTATYEIIQ